MIEKPKIGLFNVDSKIPNLALMKLSAHFKKWCYDTELYFPLRHSEYCLVYASKIFTYPHPNDAYIRKDMILGGPGFYFSKKFQRTNHVFKDLQSTNINEHVYPDYSLYDCDYAMGHITKGCPRACKWCIIPELEGNIHKFAELEEFCKDQDKVMLLDNNILAYKYHLEELKKIIRSEKKIEFTQGLDIRLITINNAVLLREIHRWKGYRLKFAFDLPELKNIIENKLEILNDVGFSSGTLQFYVLIGFNTTHQENLMRVNFLKKRGISTFIMPYNKMDPYQMHFARWVNRYFYKYETFEEYLSKKNHSIEELVMERGKPFRKKGVRTDHGLSPPRP